MRLSKTVVIVSLIASLISFCLFVSDANALVLTAGQMSEVLLAVFGAGVSSFGVGLIEYRYYRIDSEDKLLNKAHLLISAIDGLEEFCLCDIEGCNAEQLLLDYLREEETNRAVAGGPMSIVLSHASRDALIVAIEHCDEGQIAHVIENKHSCFTIYVSDSISELEKVIKSYRYYDRCLKEVVPDIKGLIEQMSYLSQDIPFIKSLGCVKGARKARYLERFIAQEEKAESALRPAIEAIRLFDRGQSSYADVMDSLIVCQKSWVCCDSKENQSRNSFAISLYNSILSFACLTSSKTVPLYESFESKDGTFPVL